VEGAVGELADDDFGDAVADPDDEGHDVSVRVMLVVRVVDVTVLPVVKDDAGKVEWIFSVDSSSVRAHQHAAGARKKGMRDRLGRGPRRQR
jgi:hypothetical protein